ncbi:Sister chromatid cohesion protein DCC1, partial [Podochytrium sp. JEL0797]
MSSLFFAAQPTFRYRLLQLPPDVASLFESGSGTSLSIRGSEDDDAVLTTASNTFAIKDVHSSNSLILVNRNPKDPELMLLEQDLEEPTADENYTVAASLATYIEINRIVPKSKDQLIHLLTPSTYHGPYLEQKRVSKLDAADMNLYSWDVLCGIVQASDEELRSSLDDLGAVELDGSFRLISPAFLNEFIQLFVASAEIEEKDTSAITIQDALQMMDEHEIPEAVILHCLRLISDEVSEAGSGIHKLSPQKICRATGIQVLMSIKHKASLHKFLKEWRKVTPGAFEISLECLKGLYLLEENTTSNQHEIFYFPKSNLPPIAKDRLDHLFQIRRKWTSTDMMPYIDDLAENKKKLDLLLLKFTRLSK